MAAGVPTPDGLFSLEGRTAVVTGASSGLGARIARVLAAAGARVAVVARRAERIERLAAEIGGVAVPADLSEPTAAETVVGTALGRLGRIDVLVNNAATTPSGLAAQDELPDDVRRVLEVNLEAPFRLCQLAGRDMLARGEGAIINVTSIVAAVGIGRLPQASYVMSKGGLDALTRELAAQWGRAGVRVNSLAPGFFLSEITDTMFDEPKIADWLRRNTPLERTGVVDDFDGAVLFLASDAGRFVTGTTVTVDGGWTAR